MLDYFTFAYYLSRKDGLIDVKDARDVLDLIAIEHGVGDIVYTRVEEPDSRTGLGFMGERLRVLLTQNHYRIQEIARLTEALENLRKKYDLLSLFIKIYVAVVVVALVVAVIVWIVGAFSG